MSRLSGVKGQEKVRKTLADLGLDYLLKGQDDPLIEENGKNLSGGERERVLFAIAYLQGKPLYVFDEITSSIDKESAQILMDSIQRLAKDHLVLMITHDSSEALKAQQVLSFANGQLMDIKASNTKALEGVKA